MLLSRKKKHIYFARNSLVQCSTANIFQARYISECFQRRGARRHKLHFLAGDGMSSATSWSGQKEFVFLGMNLVKFLHIPNLCRMHTCIKNPGSSSSGFLAEWPLISLLLPTALLFIRIGFISNSYTITTFWSSHGASGYKGCWSWWLYIIISFGVTCDLLTLYSIGSTYLLSIILLLYNAYVSVYILSLWKKKQQ